MIEYTTALLLILITYLVAVINIKFYILSLLIVPLDVFILLPEPITTGEVIVGYYLTGSTITPLLQTFEWLRIVILVGMVLCSATAIMKMSGRLG